jgi:cysteinyl-tRNA synthetase
MSIRLYNTLTRSKDAFVPIDDKNVRMYVCGPTVYDDAHIGNARPIIIFDLLFRLLRHTYGEASVTYARNITDLDDKINLRAHERGITIRELTEGTAARFHAAIRALGVLMPEDVNRPGEASRFHEPRATDHIEEMKVLCERLVAAGHAYVAEDHVLFDVPSMAEYGRLSKRPLDDMIAGARVDVAPYKRSEMDFVLWKPSIEAHEPGWPSPCGIAQPGRPGWHIECSAMAWKSLGEVFDIHGGGIDLVFPHHENEVAQTRCAFGHGAMANVWMHNGFLQVEGEKMSKSLGNFVTIQELLQEYHGSILRLTMLKTHYSQPIDWTRRSAVESQFELAEWSVIITNEEAYIDYPNDLPLRVDSEVIEALRDDLNVPQAFARIREIAKHARGHRENSRHLYATLKWMGFKDIEKPALFSNTIVSNTLPFDKSETFSLAMLHRNATANSVTQFISEEEQSRLAKSGIEFTIDHRGAVDGAVTDPSEAAFGDRVRELIDQRNAARKAKDFAESDRIRDELAAMGIQLKDGKDPATGEPVTTWEVAR